MSATVPTAPSPIDPIHRPGADVLGVSFAAATAMWIGGYVLHIPLIAAPPWLTLIWFLLCMIGGGYVLGRATDRSVGAAWVVGLLTSTINLLVLGAFVADGSTESPAAYLWVPGFALANLATATLGWGIGRRRRTKFTVIAQTADHTLNGPAVFGGALVAATALVVVAGGLVTGADAGFSVPDWPRSFGANMFLLPLSRMTGGIYYEHAHRLAGTLVGLTALVFMAHTLLTDRRGSAKVLACAAFLCVCVQGVIGGLWVIGGGEQLNAAAASGAEHAEMPIALVAFHGVFGQVVLGLMVVLALMQTRLWHTAEAQPSESAWTDRGLHYLLLAALLVQLVLGVLLRKTGGMLLVHLGFATVVIGFALAAGLRAQAIHGPRWRVLRWTGGMLAAGVLVQLLLGFAALGFRQPDKDRLLEVGSDAVSPALSAFMTTLHQSTGAALLALAAAQCLWIHRLIRPAPGASRRPSAESMQPDAKGAGPPAPSLSAKGTMR